jgi:hypothetical protein
MPATAGFLTDCSLGPDIAGTIITLAARVVTRLFLATVAKIARNAASGSAAENERTEVY